MLLFSCRREMLKKTPRALLFSSVVGALLDRSWSVVAPNPIRHYSVCRDSLATTQSTPPALWAAVIGRPSHPYPSPFTTPPAHPARLRRRHSLRGLPASTFEKNIAASHLEEQTHSLCLLHGFFDPSSWAIYLGSSLLPLCGWQKRTKMLSSVQKAESPKRVYFVKYKNLFYLYITKYTFYKIILFCFVCNRPVAMPQ